jgi:hypothetical protein
MTTSEQIYLMPEPGPPQSSQSLERAGGDLLILSRTAYERCYMPTLPACMSRIHTYKYLFYFLSVPNGGYRISGVFTSMLHAYA